MSFRAIKLLAKETYEDVTVIQAIKKTLYLLGHRTGIAVPVPRASNIACNIDNFSLQAQVCQCFHLMDSTKAGADHQRIDVLFQHFQLNR